MLFSGEQDAILLDVRTDILFNLLSSVPHMTTPAIVKSEQWYNELYKNDNYPISEYFSPNRIKNIDKVQ